MDNVVGYCILLNNNDTRNQNVLRELKRVGLDWVEPIYNEKDVDGKRGCFLAHQLAVSMFKNTNKEFAFIFEDDVLFDLNLENIQYHIKKISNLLNDYDVIALGAVAVAPMKFIEKKFYEGRWNFTHAYAIRKECADEIYRMKYEGVHFDQVLASCKHLKSGLIHPAIAFQQSYDGVNLTNTESSMRYKVLTQLRNTIGQNTIQYWVNTFFIFLGRFIH